MIVKDAEFLISIADINKLPALHLPAIVFVGRSNVGKSSLINFLCGRKNLAKVSALPGRTRLINFFEVLFNKAQKTTSHFPDNLIIVDLPGYGFAKAAKEEKAKWQDLLGQYLTNCKEIQRVIMLVDIRHKPSDLDKLMLKFLYTNQMPFKVIATKSDKLSKSEINKNLLLIASELGLGRDNLFACSVNDVNIKEKAWQFIIE